MNKLILFSVFFSLMISCKKEEVEDEVANDKIVAEDNSIAEGFSDEVTTMADEAYSSNKLSSRGSYDNGGILADTVKITKVDSTVTIDFGTTGVVGKDGRLRKGKIIISFNGGYRKTSSMVTQSFQDYSVGGNQFSNTSTRKLTYKGLDSLGNPSWDIVADITITKANGKTISWTSTRTRTMIAGLNTPLNWTDDVYKIIGSASGTTSNGKTYTLTIDKALIAKVICPHLQEGIISHTRGTRTFSIDYGYGTGTPCDAQAELTLPNGTKSIINM